jgi:hypothetical protein
VTQELSDGLRPAGVRAPSGSFNSEDRHAALVGALPLLGVYFAGGHTSVDHQQVVGVGSGDLDPAVLGLRLRVALAAGRKFLRILRAARDARAFRYESVSAEQTGHLAGVLDVTRWVTRPRGGGEEISYPVTMVARGARTPENILAAYAARWIVRELRYTAAAHTVSESSSDYRAARALVERIERETATSQFAGLQDDVRRLRTTGSVRQLAAAVRRRVRRREMATPAPFAALVDWVESALAGEPMLAPGEVDIGAYDESFDPKLFELWCLGQLASQLAVALNVPVPTVQAWRPGEPAFTFANFAGSVRVHFQASITTVDSSRVANWRTARGAALRGIPDIVVAVSPRGVDAPRIVVIDPKLRKRDRAPAEELYKVLGYFQNFAIEPPRGALLTYTTSKEPAGGDVYRDGAGGSLVWAALNPSAAQGVIDAAYHGVVEIVLDALGYEAPPRVDSGASVEDTLTGLRQSLEAWAAVHSADVAPSLERMSALLGDECWARLSMAERTMVATADTLGHQLDRAGDFSGPVIGLAAAVESFVHRTVFAHAFSAEELAANRRLRTFGAQLWAIRDACGGAGEQQLRAHIETAGIAIADLEALNDDWEILNTRWRIPAAHREVLTHGQWRASYAMVVGGGNLLKRTVAALDPSTPLEH